MKIYILRAVSFLLILLNAFFIFNFSAQKAETSKNTSRRVTETVLQITVSDFEEKPEAEKQELIQKTNPKIRTLAHFLEYTLLGFLLAFHLSLYSMIKIKGASFAFAGCALYAIIDEIHQLFVPGRSFQLRDIFTDCLGIILGIGFFVLIRLLYHKLRKNPAVT